MSQQFEAIKIDSLDKTAVFNQAKGLLDGLNIIDSDQDRPWGFFLSVDESQAPRFIERFYEGISLDDIDTALPLRPKILGIAPHRRLSWQYHHRRNEKWRCLTGHFHIILSETDNEDEGKTQPVEPGEPVTILQGTRHRAAGLDKWALVAEIWQHTDPAHLSDENDIVRVQDDFGRQ